MVQAPGGAAARGQRGGQPLEPVDPRDLLDQVDLTRDVGAAQRGHGHVETAVGLSFGRSAVDSAVRYNRAAGEVECLQDLALALGGHGDTEDRLHARLAQAQHLKRRQRLRDVDRPGRDARTGALDHQPRGDRLRVHAQLWLQPLLKARGGLAA